MENGKDYLEKVYNLAVLRGFCRTRKEFAALLGINDKGLSAAMNGKEKNLTPSLLRKVEAWSRDHELEQKTSEPKEPDIVIPAATAKMYENLTETIRLQAEMLSRMQAGTFVAGGYAPKNSRIEND